jgi:hypothetical protein
MIIKFFHDGIIKSSVDPEEVIVRGAAYWPHDMKK